MSLKASRIAIIAYLISFVNARITSIKAVSVGECNPVHGHGSKVKCKARIEVGVSLDTSSDGRYISERLIIDNISNDVNAFDFHETHELDGFQTTRLSDSAAGQDDEEDDTNNIERLRLATPITLDFEKSDVNRVYELTKVGTVAAFPREMSSVDYGKCGTAHAGFMYNDRTPIDHTDGFCCDLTNQSQAGARNFLFTQIRSVPDQHALYHSVHAFNKGDSYWNLYNHVPRGLDFKIDIKARADNFRVHGDQAVRDMPHIETITLNPSQSTATFTGDFVAERSAQLRLTSSSITVQSSDQETPSDWNDYYLSRYDQQESNRRKEVRNNDLLKKVFLISDIFRNAARITALENLVSPAVNPAHPFRDGLLIPVSAVNLDGSQCNKIGVGYQAFKNNQNPCSKKIGSCLENQIVDFAASPNSKTIQSDFCGGSGVINFKDGKLRCDVSKSHFTDLKVILELEDVIAIRRAYDVVISNIDIVKSDDDKPFLSFDIHNPAEASLEIQASIHCRSFSNSNDTNPKHFPVTLNSQQTKQIETSLPYNRDNSLIIDTFIDYTCDITIVDTRRRTIVGQKGVELIKFIDIYLKEFAPRDLEEARPEPEVAIPEPEMRIPSNEISEEFQDNGEAEDKEEEELEAEEEEEDEEVDGSGDSDDADESNEIDPENSTDESNAPEGDDVSVDEDISTDKPVLKMHKAGPGHKQDSPLFMFCFLGVLMTGICGTVFNRNKRFQKPTKPIKKRKVISV